MCAPPHRSCWRVKVCHDSSMYYTLSDFSSREQHFFFGRVTTLARNRLFSENTLGRTSLPKGWNWDVCAGPPTVSLRHTEACVHTHKCPGLCMCAQTHAVNINALGDISHYARVSHLHTVLPQSLAVSHNSFQISSFLAALSQCPWSARTAPHSVV